MWCSVNKWLPYCLTSVSVARNQEWTWKQFPFKSFYLTAKICLFNPMKSLHSLRVVSLYNKFLLYAERCDVEWTMLQVFYKQVQSHHVILQRIPAGVWYTLATYSIIQQFHKHLLLKHKLSLQNLWFSCICLFCSICMNFLFLTCTGSPLQSQIVVIHGTN